LKKPSYICTRFGFDGEYYLRIDNEEFDPGSG